MKPSRLLLSLCAFALCGCAGMNFANPFTSDPLTGGVDAAQSQLLQIDLPAGLQRYPSHSSVSGGSRKEGLETLRGHVDQSACAMSFYGRLKADGWQLRMYQRHGYRAIYIYQKGDVLAALVFHRQGMLTILEIWTCARLADNAALAPAHDTDAEPLRSIAPEEYGPESKNGPGESEEWGVKEREL